MALIGTLHFTASYLMSSSSILIFFLQWLGNPPKWTRVHPPNNKSFEPICHGCMKMKPAAWAGSLRGATGTSSLSPRELGYRNPFQDSESLEEPSSLLHSSGPTSHPNLQFSPSCVPWFCIRAASEPATAMALNVGSAVPGTVGVGAFSASRASASQLYHTQGVQLRKSQRDGACVCEVSDSKEAVTGDAPSPPSGNSLYLRGFHLCINWVFHSLIPPETHFSGEVLHSEKILLQLNF
jgi:hypothetical protein